MIVGAWVAGYFYLQNNPTKIQEVLGCNTSEQTEFNDTLAKSINLLLEQTQANTQQLQELTTTIESYEENTTNTENEFLLDLPTDFSPDSITPETDSNTEQSE